MSRQPAPRALILMYHAVEPARSALSVTPELFRSHLRCIAESGARVVTVRALAEELRRAKSPRDFLLAITFDDGFESVAELAAPLLAERELPATVFCVAGRLGGTSDWPSGRAGGTTRALASASALRDLSQAGFEIGSHGFDHEPLVADAEQLLRREIADSKSVLEEAVGTHVSSFAYPYGAGPSRLARRLVEETYEAACTTKMASLSPQPDRYALPRVDVHYVRRPELLARVLAGRIGPYLVARRIGARTRRALWKDYLTDRSFRWGDTPQTTRAP